MSNRLKMSDVRVGMRLRLSPEICGDDRPITVTGITPRGFTYRYDEAKSLIPRWGWTTPADGHEHFGFNGESLYVPVGDEPVDAQKETA